MLASKNRFHGHGSLRFVYARGKVSRSKYFICKYSHNPRRATPRVAVVVSKKVVKSAVKRNRIRRRMYEAIRLELPDISRQTDVVYIVVSPEILFIPHSELIGAIRRTLQAAELYKVAAKWYTTSNIIY